ncbi:MULTISPECIES: tripartite tricarboxylate transporter substrate binding protein [unclassified Massilia]|uniref:tripartite tricarboxylate transporter substrate binding protein n=1 Tax=unclassified Massilia TaxID=2609279 RepID=UPI001B81E044|nr:MULTISPECIES: tripartite tricarboxylate transporter substrate-binding protein [unclassified Massilia]MBQ5939204.1 tripartite tricarboxylate transporter substrate binding protein [Massilia sp. AB1]MBQ5964184.1 tripartite tricarboxylate transporter substrate binding protein [Massilia sp. ZL223]
MTILRFLSSALLCAACMAGSAHGGEAECIVPSKPGGAMDLTCKLARKALPEGPGDPRLRLSYMPGGIGAVAWHALVSQRRAEPDTLVAFSGGSLLNLAQGKFGKATADDVRWVAALGADYGMIAVRADAPWRSLGELVEAIRRDPQAVLIGVSGTIGSQDWMKMALLARLAGIDPKQLRFVALEGGGEGFTAMAGGHVQAISGDASEASLYAGPGKVRVLAVLSEKRLPGVLAKVPTAREQGYDLVWPVIRGVWMGPDVPDADYRRWVAAFERMQAAPGFARLREQAGLTPFSLTGEALTRYIKQAVTDYNRQARQFKLVRQH